MPLYESKAQHISRNFQDICVGTHTVSSSICEFFKKLELHEPLEWEKPNHYLWIVLESCGIPCFLDCRERPQTAICCLSSGNTETQVDASWDLGQLATSFGQGLRALALTCAHFDRDQICTQVDVNISPFGHPTQVNASWVTSINPLLANKIEDSLP